MMREISEEQAEMLEKFIRGEIGMKDVSYDDKVIIMEYYTLKSEENELKKNEEVLKKAGVLAVVGTGLLAGVQWVLSNM